MTCILYPLSTEKAIAKIEGENKITVIVLNSATRTQIKEDGEKYFGEKIGKVNITIDRKGRKKAAVTFTKKGAATDVAAKLKMI